MADATLLILRCSIAKRSSLEEPTVSRPDFIPQPVSVGGQLTEAARLRPSFRDGPLD